MFQYLAFLPLLARHPNLVQAFSDNLPEAQQFLAEGQALLNKHKTFLDRLQKVTPEFQQFVAEAQPILAQVRLMP